MTRRAAIIAALAWGEALLVLPLGVALAWLQFANDRRHGAYALLGGASVAVALLAVAAVGALVASRRPGNPIGWLFGGATLLTAIGYVALEAGIYALATAPGALPAGASAWLALLGRWLRDLGWFTTLTYLLLLFPTGRLPSPRWRPAAWLAAACLAYYAAYALLTPGLVDPRLPHLRSPLPAGDQATLLAAAAALLAITLPICAAAPVVRFRAARGAARAQLKWFAYAVVVTFLLATALLFDAAIFHRLPDAARNIIWAVSLVGIPVASGVAILRHRLYDIDLLINRTLVYGALTAILAAVYFAGVVLSQALVRAITGQESPLAVVAITLAIAALANPLRRRLQAFIDRRFYRERYDARRALTAFGARLRDEVELATLARDLCAIVDETMQPASVALWLPPGVQDRGDVRPGTGGRDRGAAGANG